MEQALDAEDIIKKAEAAVDDDAESMIANERYTYITSIIGKSCQKKKTGLTLSDKIDQIVTNRILALPIFAAVMFFVYYVSVTTVGTMATDFVNDSQMCIRDRFRKSPARILPSGRRALDADACLLYTSLPPAIHLRIM